MTGGVPSGVVSFLFTDVERSTRLWQADPEGMRASLEQLRQRASELLGEESAEQLFKEGEGLELDHALEEGRALLATLAD